MRIRGEEAQISIHAIRLYHKKLNFLERVDFTIKIIYFLI